MKPSLGSMFRWIVWRDLALAWRRRSDALAALFFFAIVVSLFPLSAAPDPKLLRAIAPGVIWVAAVLAWTLSLGRLFASDHADGTLEQMLVSPQPLFLIVLGKVIAQTIVVGLPLAIMAPLAAIQFGLPETAPLALAIALAAAAPALGLVGAIGAALTLGLRGGGALVFLLTLPLHVPTVVFGAGAVEASLRGKGPDANLYLLAATFVLALFFAPWAASAALRLSQE